MTELRHGYTLADIHAIARQAVHTDWSHSASDYLDRLDTAWYGVAEHLYEAPAPPSRRDLVHAGRAALHAETQKELSARGISYHYDYAEMVNFIRYWDWFARTVPSHEERVVDRLTLTQVWPQLKEADQQTLLALAAHGDYLAAAEATGRTYHTFAAAVRRARLRFLELWHHGEQPSRPWGADRRVGRRAAGEPRMGEVGRAGVLAVRRRRQAKARAA